MYLVLVKFISEKCVLLQYIIKTIACVFQNLHYTGTRRNHMNKTTVLLYQLCIKTILTGSGTFVPGIFVSLETKINGH